MRNENNYLTHGIHPYHAKFIPEIPKEFMHKYSSEGDRILDPFCGSGTTLLEGMLNSRRCVGVDMNEIAYRISKAKVFNADPEILDKYYESIMMRFEDCEIEKPIIFSNKETWYSQEVITTFDKLLTLIEKIEDCDYQNIFKIIISSMTKTVSNKRKIWNNGYIADNVMPDKLYTGNALKVFEQRYKHFRYAYSELQNYLKTEKYFKPEVYKCNILEYKTKWKFDMIITSPPYPFAVDFAKYNRLSFYWLGVDVDKSADEETGARAKRNKKDAEKTFFREMKKIYLHLFSLVKENGYFCMTVANTRRKNISINFVQWLIDLFEENGWSLIENEVRSLQNQSMAQKRIQKEYKLVFRKDIK